VFLGVAPRSRRRPPSEARFSTRCAATSALALAPASHPSPAPPFLTAFLLRAAASTGPTTPAVAAPLPSRLLHLHRSVPPSRPSIRPRLASSSRFVYTCCILDLMCCARLPSFSTPSPRCRTARAGRMHKDEAGAGLRRWGASRGAEHTTENASRPGVKVR